ncbi:MAG TPA: HD domain-containing protein [Candidatus Baltobacteraceae bacterium]|jgi:hypothetical protein|nr:HD domain-containing protein [Candidatus Baltobacteraceae bacterium]
MKRIFDPIHRFIELDEAEVALLDTPPLQRLRRLRQLGLAYLVFPSAEHSRFSHVLGAMAVGERVLSTLRTHDDGYFSDDQDYGRQRKLLRASLLLHDVGHGPFSHSSEAVLGRRHELRTAEILELAPIQSALQRLDVDPHEIEALVVGTRATRYPVLKEIVSGPNLDADRMDYLLRDTYFTGVAGGRYDADQLIASLRVIAQNGNPTLGVDGRGVVALESFVLARYMMFATVYFHHTARLFEHTLQDALKHLWPNPRSLDSIDEFLSWDDLRVVDAFRTLDDDSARALRDRRRLHRMVMEFNAERDLSIFERCRKDLEKNYGSAVWADTQEELLHRLPLGVDSTGPTVLVRTRSGVVDAREASDLIGKLSGKAHWRKLYVAQDRVDVAQARRRCREIVAHAREGRG